MYVAPSNHPAGFRALPPGVQFVILAVVPVLLVFLLIFLCKIVEVLTRKKRTRGEVHKLDPAVLDRASRRQRQPRKNPMIAIVEIEEPEKPPPQYFELFPAEQPCSSNTVRNCDSKY